MIDADTFHKVAQSFVKGLKVIENVEIGARDVDLAGDGTAAGEFDKAVKVVFASGSRAGGDDGIEQIVGEFRGEIKS